MVSRQINADPQALNEGQGGEHGLQNVEGGGKA